VQFGRWGAVARLSCGPGAPLLLASACSLAGWFSRSTQASRSTKSGSDALNGEAKMHAIEDFSLNPLTLLIPRVQLLGDGQALAEVEGSS